MELHELHVGEARTGAVRDGEAVAGGDERVRGVAVELPAPAGGEHGGVGQDVGGLSREAHPRADADAVVVHDQVEDASVLEHLHPVARAHSLDERARDLGARAVAVRVDDALPRVRGLATELELARGVEIEVGPRSLELANPRGPFRHQHLDGLGVAQRTAGGEGVLPVQLRGVPRPERRRDPTLGVGGGAVEEGALGGDDDVPPLRGAPGRMEPGHAAADDEEAGAETGGHS